MFDKIVCLSLDKRYNNQEDIKTSFISKEMDVQFFLCGNGDLFPKHNYDHIDVVPPPGRYGYPAWVKRPNSYNAFLSFRKIIQSAKKDGIGSLLILEDDVVLLDNFDEVFLKAASQLEKDWEMFYLGAGHTFSKNKMFSENLIQLNGSGGWWAVALRDTIFDEILNLPITHPIDEISAKTLHKRGKSFACWPSVAWQRAGFSHCEGSEVSYWHYLKDNGCS